MLFEYSSCPINILTYKEPLTLKVMLDTLAEIQADDR